MNNKEKLDRLYKMRFLENEGDSMCVLFDEEEPFYNPYGLWQM